MKADQEKQLEARARIMKAMAHPTRLFIIEELSRGERCVAEITGMVDADISTVSKHLSVLKQAGLVMDEKRGTSIYYHLRVSCVMDFMCCVERYSRQMRRIMRISIACAANADRDKFYPVKNNK